MPNEPQTTNNEQRTAAIIKQGAAGQRCSNCRFARVPADGNLSSRDCHRYPMQVCGDEDGIHGYGHWPKMPSNSWCGEHEWLAEPTADISE